MGFITSIKTCFKKYFDFSGRARRSEYWWFYLFTIIGSIVLSIVDAALFGLEVAGTISPLSSLFGLAVLIPTLSAAARRLHDINRSGWFQLLPLGAFLLLIPAVLFGLAAGGGESPIAFIFAALFVLAIIVLAIILIVWLATDSHFGPNRFGDNPKGEGNASVFD